jgi:hypothetical protein
MRWVLLIILFTLAATTARADEFVVRSFAASPNDLAAIQSGCTDVNNEECAIIKVQTDLGAITFDSGKKLVQDVEYINGEYLLYVSPGERRITLIKEGFITFHFQIPVAIEPSKVYRMVVTNKGGGGGSTGTLHLITDPPDAKVTIRELPDLELTTPALLENYPTFRYSIRITKQRYAAIDTVFAILPNEQITHTLTLEPTWGDLKIEVAPADASIYINGEFKSTGGRTFSGVERGIDTGVQTVTVSKEGYYPITETVSITNGTNPPLSVNLRAIKGFLQIEAVPENATLLINGQPSTLPFADSVQIGTYNLLFEHPECMAVKKTVEVIGKQTTPVREVLPNLTEVRLTSSPSQADVYRNNSYLGRTPLNAEVTYGYNELVLKKENYEDYNISINVDKEDGKFHFQLQPVKYNTSITTRPSDATIYVDRREAGKSPADLNLAYGRYRIMAEKRGYFRKRKVLRIDRPEISYHFNLQKLKHIRFGVIYGDQSYGGEFTWSDNLTGFAIGYYQPRKLAFENTPDHENINTFDYINLSDATEVGKITNTDSLNFLITAKVHAHLNKIPTFSFVFGMALGRETYSTVYRATDDIESWIFGDDIEEGDYFSVAEKGNFRASPIAGVSLRFFRIFYAGAEYWFNTGRDDNLRFNGGICLPIN